MNSLSPAHIIYKSYFLKQPSLKNFHFFLFPFSFQLGLIFFPLLYTSSNTHNCETEADPHLKRILPKWTGPDKKACISTYFCLEKEGKYRQLMHNCITPVKHMAKQPPQRKLNWVWHLCLKKNHKNIFSVKDWNTKTEFLSHV